MTDETLPPGMARLWGSKEPGGHEGKRGLTVERVVAAGIALADEDGLAAVSMGRVAKRLGFTTMALYRHVESKDELLVLMVNEAVGEPAADVAGGGWRAQMERWCAELLDQLRVHPWVLDVPIGGPPATPAQLAWMDRGFAALEDTALTEAEKGVVVLMLNGQVFWEARVSLELARGAQRGDDAVMTASFISGVLEGGRFPAVRRALDAGIFEDDSAEADLARGVGIALDGVERLVERRAAERR